MVVLFDNLPNRLSLEVGDIWFLFIASDLSEGSNFSEGRR